MPLVLKSVPAARGPRWVSEAFRSFARRPLAFTALFAVFLFSAVVLSLLPLIGGLLQMASVPLLSLGFMIATQSALLDGPVTPAQFVEPFRRDPARRRALLQLCLGYGVAAALLLATCEALSDNALVRLQLLMGRGPGAQAEIDALLAEPGVLWAGLLGLGGGTLLTVPFWHAPALVHWGGQGAGQALFSSALAVWRNKGAMTTYGLTWCALVAAFGALTALLFGALGAGQLAPLASLPAGLMFSTVFYVSLLFGFNDSFGSADAR